jgi:predicted Zn-dependent protease
MALRPGFRFSCWIACLLTGAASGSPLAQRSVTYAEAVATYQKGDIDGAIRVLAELTDNQCWSEANRFWMQPIRSSGNWLPAARAAVLLHTEVWLRRAGARVTVGRDAQFDSARTIVRALKRLVSELGPAHGDPEFVRDWYLLVAAYLHGRAEVGRSRSLLEEVRQSFRSDALVLLASGADHEILSTFTTGFVQSYDASGERLDMIRVDAETELRHAAKFFREALKGEPGLLETRLRLGRVLYRQGEADAAARELEEVRAAAKSAPLTYLADVFLGMIETARGRYPRAAELYGQALQIYPAAQTALIGMSELAYLDGRPADAASAITKVLEQPNKEDPWWQYLFGEWWHFDGRLMALRKRVQS